MASATATAAVACLALAAICGTIALIPILSKNAPPHDRSLSNSYAVEPYHIPRLNDKSLGRRLTVSLPKGGCRLTFPKKPPPNVQITYAASYPGCGARMTWNLVEALTGLWTGDDWNNNGRGQDVATLKTHYPQSNGVLVEFDEIIQRAFIVIRNPIDSIPSFFNHIYEMRNHLPVHSQRAPVKEWVKWRNTYLEDEIREYKKFIFYWMDRYTPENRLLITYEGLTDDLIGAEVAKGLNEFLGRAEGVTTVEPESVPCVWRAVVKNQPPPQQKARIEKLQKLADNRAPGDVKRQPKDDLPPQRPGELRRRLNPGHYNSQRAGPAVPRPYTPQQLDKMMNMLLEVAQQYHEKDARLYHIMMGYYEQVREKRTRLSSELFHNTITIKPPGGFH